MKFSLALIATVAALASASPIKSSCEVPHKGMNCAAARAANCPCYYARDAPAGAATDKKHGTDAGNGGNNWYIKGRDAPAGAATDKTHGTDAGNSGQNWYIRDAPTGNTHGTDGGDGSNTWLIKN